MSVSVYCWDIVTFLMPLRRLKVYTWFYVLSFSAYWNTFQNEWIWQPHFSDSIFNWKLGLPWNYALTTLILLSVFGVSWINREESHRMNKLPYTPYSNKKNWAMCALFEHRMTLTRKIATVSRFWKMLEKNITDVLPSFKVTPMQWSQKM